MATEYPYVNSAGKLSEFMGRLGSIGVPDKVNHKFLESLGYKSKNDRRFLSVLRFLKLTDDSGTPTDAYRSTFRGGEKGKAGFAKLVRENYADLFSTYPDAYRKDNEALQNFFTAHTDVGSQAVQLMTVTFKTVSSFGDFSSGLNETSFGENGASEESFREGKNPEGPPIVADSQPQTVASAQTLTLNVNIQLELPATSDSSVYNALFEAMAKHIMRLPKTE